MWSGTAKLVILLACVLFLFSVKINLSLLSSDTSCCASAVLFAHSFEILPWKPLETLLNTHNALLCHSVTVLILHVKMHSSSSLSDTKSHRYHQSIALDKDARKYIINILFLARSSLSYMLIVVRQLCLLI